jgi:prepilin-type N-terminal cleavage/methylation domain-containing protein
LTLTGADRREHGFTLIELLVAITIETLIMGSIGFAFVTILNGSTSIRQSLSRSGDARIAAAYIVSDARNSSGPETALADTASCPDPSPPVAGTATPVVRFSFDTTSSIGVATTTVVNYVLVANQLLRRQCNGGALVSDGVIAQTIASITAACAPTADCTGDPTSITAAVTETPDSNGEVFTYTLTGAFRKALAVGAPIVVPETPALMAFGTTACTASATGIRLTGGADVRVYGKTFVNTADGSTCPAMSVTSSATFRSGTTGILTGGTCVVATLGVCPTSTTYSPAKGDPYATLAAPSTTGMTSRSGCGGGVASPGVYASALSITGTCRLATGIYVLRAGLNVSSSAAVTNGAGGVLIYLTGGAFTVANTASVTLAAQTSGTYSGLAVWQASTDTSTVAFSNSGALSFTGAVYAPKAQVSISGLSPTPNAGAVLAQTIVATSNIAIIIGSPSATPLAIDTPAAPPAWTVNQPFPPTTLTATGGDGAYIWSLSGLPGISVDATTGVISGTPTTVGTFSITLTLNDALGDDAASLVYSSSVNDAPSISTTSLPTGEKSVAYSTTLSGTGGTNPTTWSATGLPAGLAIDSNSGTISGAPTASGSFTAVVTMTDVTGASATKSLPLTIAPQPAIVSVSLVNGGSTTGRLEKGDKIVVVYSAQMDVSGMCSAWSGDTTNQTLNANNDVTVSVSNGATDALTVTSATCAFHFGSLNLGSSAYVTSAAAFSGAGSNTSSIAWTAATHTLTITLGALKSGAVATVTSSTPVYTASGLIVDTPGAVLGNSPFTLPAAKQF